MSNSIQGCNDLIKSLVAATGSYQDAMFLYLTILMSENVELGVRERLYNNLESLTQDFNIVAISTPKDKTVIEVYILNSHETFSSGCPSAGVSSQVNSNDNLFLSTFQKNEKGEWSIINKTRASFNPAKETIWKKY